MTFLLNFLFVASIILVILVVILLTAIGIDWETRWGISLLIVLLIFQILVEYWVMFWGRDVVFVGIDQAGELRVFTELSRRIQYTTTPLNISFFDNYALAIIPLTFFFILSRALFPFLGESAWLLTYHILLMVTGAIKSVVIFIFLCKYTTKPVSFSITTILLNSFFFISPSWWIGLRESFAIIWFLLILLNVTYRRVGVGMVLIFFTHYLVFFIAFVTLLFPLLIINSNKQINPISRDTPLKLPNIFNSISNKSPRSYYLFFLVGPLLIGIVIFPLLARYFTLVVEFAFNSISTFSISSTVLSYFTNTALWFLLTFALTGVSVLYFLNLWRRSKSYTFFDIATMVLILLLVSNFFIDDFGPERIFSSGIYLLSAAILLKLDGIESETRKRYISIGMLGILLNPLTFTPLVNQSQAVLLEGNSNFENLLLKTSVSYGEYVVAISLNDWDEGGTTIHCDWNQFRALLAFTDTDHTRFKVFQNHSMFHSGDFIIVPPYYFQGNFVISVDWQGNVVQHTKLSFDLNFKDFTNVLVIHDIYIYQVP